MLSENTYIIMRIANPPKSRALVHYTSAWIRIKSLPRARSGSTAGVLPFKATGFVSQDTTWSPLATPKLCHGLSPRHGGPSSVWPGLPNDGTVTPHNGTVTQPKCSTPSSSSSWPPSFPKPTSHLSSQLSPLSKQDKGDTTYQASPLHPSPCLYHQRAWTKSFFCSIFGVRALPWAWPWCILLSPGVWGHSEGSTRSGQWSSLHTVLKIDVREACKDQIKPSLCVPANSSSSRV